MKIPFKARIYNRKPCVVAFVLMVLLLVPVASSAFRIDVSNQQKDSIRRAIDAVLAETKPWVQSQSRPFAITNGLQNRHISVWPSHGRYYNQTDRSWKWQRPQLFGTCEDIFTQSFVNPFLIPMLESAGCVVFMPRERDWQTEEVIVDNDLANCGYTEHSGDKDWKPAPRPAFSWHEGSYLDSELPFTTGTARMVSVSDDADTWALYSPAIKSAGSHAVYVSYQTVEGSVDDAEYIVVHRGIKTVFHVNQRMGGSTWVYLGSFDFGAGDPSNNYVKVTNRSQQKHGKVTTDAVRFGGGMGNIERNGKRSYLPRALECSRYWTQWAGAPKEVTQSKGGVDDYAEDINCRSLMSNWLSYGSPYNPVLYTDTMTLDSAALAARAAEKYLSRHNVTQPDDFTGHVPIEMSIALHSDAGWMKDGKSYVGTLTICTTDFNDKVMQNGMPRSLCFDLASQLLTNVVRDLKYRYGSWVRHDFYDRNYSETRVPAQTSVILEMLSHQNFPDMRMGHDPDFKFWLARAVYKTILRSLAREHRFEPIIQPLAPKSLSVNVSDDGKALLSWRAQHDSQEPTAAPTSYNIYVGMDDGGLDNGRNVADTHYEMPLEPNRLYRFRVTAANAGGESFPTEELVALYNPDSAEKMMIINGFHRLSSPAVIDNDSIQGFDLNDDIGLSYGKTPSFCGRQKNFNAKQAGTSLGYTSNEFMGKFFAGNDFNYVVEHGRAMQSANRLNISSMSSECIDDVSTDSVVPANAYELLKGYDAVDVVLGNEKDDGHSLKSYKTFSVRMQDALNTFADNGGRIMASGSYIASDMQKDDEKAFLDKVLHVQLDSVDVVSDPFTSPKYSSAKESIIGYGKDFSAYRIVNGDHYASHKSDALRPSAEAAIKTLTYSSGLCASVAYNDGHHASYTLGFPFECIKSKEMQASLMQEILYYLLGEKRVREHKVEPVEEKVEVQETDGKKHKKNKKKKKEE